MTTFITVIVIFLVISKAAADVPGTCSADDHVCIEKARLASVTPRGANAEGKPREAVKECKDRHQQCVGFARQGECERNPGWMIINCAASCHRCHLRDPKLRCNRKALNISTVPIYQPGDMNAMFNNIEAEFGDRYKVTVHSRDPWVVTFDDFMTDQETSSIIRVVDKWERSTDTGQANEFGEVGRVLSQGRTSSNAWCREQCEADPDVRRVMNKIAEVTRVPIGNYESFQILRYEEGQYYRSHHDYGAQQKLLASGPRILTFFLYLSDVEEGGETSFTNLGMKVKPKRGRALLWPSTLDSNPEEQEPRTHHAAERVVKGLKYAANAWIHLYDFRIPNLWGCTGTFDELSD